MILSMHEIDDFPGEALAVVRGKGNLICHEGKKHKMHRHP